MPLPRLRIVNRQPSEIKDESWVSVEKKLDAMPVPWIFGEVLNLQDIKTIKFKETDSDVIVLAKLTAGGICDCGMTESTLKKNGWTLTRMVTDVPLRCKRTSVFFRAQRYYCKACRKTAQQKSDDIHPKHRLTNRVVNYIEKESLSIFKNFCEIERETGVHEKVVRAIFTSIVKVLEESRKIETPTWLAIDEVYPSGRSSPRCVITAPADRRVVDILADNGKRTLAKWLFQLPDRKSVQVVSMDMWVAYKTAVNKALPNAAIVVDRYHVHNALNVALKEVLDVIRLSLTNKQHEEYMRPEYLLLMSRFELYKIPISEKDELSKKEVVEEWFNNVPDIGRAYTLKEDFSDILHLSDRKIAEKRAILWLTQLSAFFEYFSANYYDHCKKLDKFPFGNILKTFSSLLPNILNYIDFKNSYDIKLTNSFAECTNKLIKQAYRKGNGYNFEVLRAKFVYGRFLVEDLPHHPIKPERKSPRKQDTSTNSLAGLKQDQKSNIFVLREARLKSDQSRNLVPRIQDNEEARIRFMPHEEAGTLPKDVGQFQLDCNTRAVPVNKSRSKLLEKKNSKKKNGKSNPDQLKLF